MTEITNINEDPINPRYSVSPTAFFFALICAPLLVTLFTFWTFIGLFALPLGIIPYLVVGTPILLWAVGRVEPGFWRYAFLGFAGYMVMAVIGIVILTPPLGSLANQETFIFLAGFGMIFAPLYAGTFGSLYGAFHTNIRILQT